MQIPRKTESFWELETSIGNLELASGNQKVFYVLTQIFNQLLDKGTINDSVILSHNSSLCSTAYQ